MGTERKVPWSIPRIAPLSSSEQCKDLLNLGYALINNQGFTVFLVDGKQIISNPNRRRNYKFSNPQLWQIQNDEAILNHATLRFKLELLVVKFSKWLL